MSEMTSAELKSLRVVVPDEMRRHAIIESARVLKGLQADVTVQSIADRAARTLRDSSRTIRSFILKKLNAEERLALGIKPSISTHRSRANAAE